MAVVLSVRTEKVRVIRTFDADGPEKMFVLQLFVLTDFFFDKPEGLANHLPGKRSY